MARPMAGPGDPDRHPAEGDPEHRLGRDPARPSNHRSSSGGGRSGKTVRSVVSRDRRAVQNQDGGIGRSANHRPARTTTASVIATTCAPSSQAFPAIGVGHARPQGLDPQTGQHRPPRSPGTKIAPAPGIDPSPARPETGPRTNRASAPRRTGRPTRPGSATPGPLGDRRPDQGHHGQEQGHQPERRTDSQYFRARNSSTDPPARRGPGSGAR